MELSLSYSPPPSRRFHLAPSQQSSPHAISHGFPSVHLVLASISLLPNRTLLNFQRFPFRPPYRRFRIAPSQENSPQAISNGFPSVHPIVASVSLLPQAISHDFPSVQPFVASVSLLPYGRSSPHAISNGFPFVTLSSLLYRSFPTELSPSYFPRFPFRPPCPRFHLASSPRIPLAPCRRFQTNISPSYFPRFPFRPPARHFRIAPSPRSSPGAVSHGFLSVHPLVASISLLPGRALPKLFPTISPPSTLSSLPARSFPTELSPSIPNVFPTFPLRPPSRRFHPFPPNRPLPKLFPTVSPPSTLSSLPYRSLGASATKREPKHRRCFWEKTYK